jgi:uncharacterized protein YkwD
MKRICFKISVLISTVALLSGCISGLQTSSQDMSTSSMVKSILEPVNEARSQGRMCGNIYYQSAGPVSWDENLAEASLTHSLDMARNGFLSHRGSDGSDPEARLLRAGYLLTSYGENVGQGYRTADEAVRAWLRSERHCRNIMNQAFKEVGAAYAMNNNLRRYWTLVLARPK